MITEDYVSFETAKRLKEKGFYESCERIYDEEGYLLVNKYGYINEQSPNEYFHALAPTLQMAMKWLREVHNLAIVVTPSMFWGKYNVHIYEKGNEYPIGFDGNSLCSSYEQAAEAAIKYCLENLI